MVHAYKGQLITFEGVDGSGKTTQWQQAVAWLKSTYPTLEIVQTRNPGGTPLGQALRRLLLTPTVEELGTALMAPTTELLLYMADRSQHVAEVVMPALQRGAIVLCDRFIDSSVAYQGGARGLSTQMIHQLNDIACQGVTPDCTLLFDAPPEVLARRMSARGALDRLEQEGLSFQTKVREGFLAIQQAESTRFRVIDASQPIETVTQQVQKQLITFLTQANVCLV
jgi:dTMP kinase